MKYISIYFLFCLFLFIHGSCKKETTDPKIYDAEILEKLNSYRIGKGLKPFEANDFMWELAQAHSTAMANGSVPFGHDSATYRYEQIRLKYGNGITTENIDWGFGTADEVVLRWTESVGHKENIEGDYTLTAISAVKSKDGKFYYTQLFYKKY
jgi:uncharacterized protein YkwD